MIDRFFRPFLGGIFFDSSLQISSRLFYFVMRMLALGQNCLPARGIGAVSAQLASQLPPAAIHLNTRVSEVLRATPSAPATVVLASGARITAAQGVIIAVEGPEAVRLAGAKSLPAGNLKPRGSCCVYFACAAPPRILGVAEPEPILFLNGERGGIVNNICFPSVVAPSYAPHGRTLASVEVLGVPDIPDEELAEVRAVEISSGGSVPGSHCAQVMNLNGFIEEMQAFVSEMNAVPCCAHQVQAA